MAVSDYQFRAYDFDGVRLIRSTLPSVINDSELAVVTWRFLELYETERPYAVLSDYSRVEELSDRALGVVGALIEKSFADMRFMGAVWVTGSKTALAWRVGELLESLGHDAGLVVSTQAEGIAALRARGVPVPDGFEFERPSSVGTDAE